MEKSVASMRDKAPLETKPRMLETRIDFGFKFFGKCALTKAFM